jgi:hypothetical protein
MGKFSPPGANSERENAKTAKREKIKKPKVLDLGEKDGDEEAKPAPEASKVEEEKKAGRDFASDLKIYVTTWRTDKSNWKFNKNLQNWALNNCFDGDKIDKQLFHDALPYLVSVVGKARESLINRCDEHLESTAEENTASRRSKKIKSYFMKSDEDKK